VFKEPFDHLTLAISPDQLPSEQLRDHSLTIAAAAAFAQPSSGGWRCGLD
jgi:hypothetical protein